jgi:hypothetical protein
VLVWNGSEWINSSFPVPAGSPGDIQYNDGGILGGSSATVDAIGNIVALTGSITTGNLSALPAFIGFPNVSYGALNYMSGTIPAGGIHPTTGVGTLLNLAAYCPDAHTTVVAANVNAIGSYTVSAHFFEAVAASGSNGCELIGNEGYIVLEDGTVSNTIAVCYYASIPPIPTGATATESIGFYSNVNSGTGTTTAIGFGTRDVAADPSSGTAIGLSISNTISGATTYAIKSLSTAQSLFAGSLSATTLIEANTLTPSSGATAGVTGQIAWDTGFIYICTVGGGAGSATWKKAALTAA